MNPTVRAVIPLWPPFTLACDGGRVSQDLPATGRNCEGRNAVTPLTVGLLPPPLREPRRRKAPDREIR
jgi:hypothetical protein